MANFKLEEINIYHIVHLDRLASIINDGYLWSCSQVQQQQLTGSNIGMDKIKQRRSTIKLTSYPNLAVGECVPFYFCPRSVMLYLFHKNNHTEIDYHGGQQPILHLVANLQKVLSWAEQHNKNWVFTTSNAGSFYFDDYNSLQYLDKIDWQAVTTNSWQACQDKKQAEFLIENKFPWQLIDVIGVYAEPQLQQVQQLLAEAKQPTLQIKRNWYY
jgi:hypothetical protein